MASILEFLEARLTEDEAFAAQAQGEHYGWVDNWRAETQHGTKTETVIYSHAFRFSPQRMLAECAAKRAVLTYLAGLDVDQRRDSETYAQFRSVRWVAEQMAAVYADHPDYQQEWERV